jgi:rare lipoprotein A
MRAMRTISVPTAAKLAVGASVLAFPATAVAVTSDTQAAVATPQPVALHDVHTVKTAYGVKTLVRGAAPVADAGRRLALEYRPDNAGPWRTVGRGEVRPDGRFSLSARLGRTGALQVVPVPDTARPEPNQVSGQTTAGTTVTPTATTSTPRGTSELKASPVSAIHVRPRLTLSARQSLAIVGHQDHVTGHLLPGIAGRRVELQVHRDGRWVPVAGARTRRGGGFDVHFSAPDAAHEITRVAFTGDRLNTGAHSDSEDVSGMAYAEVSWYYDAGNTACGFHATYGIASRTLPCGSKVTLSYAGRTVTATVDDRGPFVYSRLYDLNQTTAAALGMNGVATVLASI